MTPAHATTLRVPLPRILAGLVAALLIVIVPAAWSGAATVPGAITNVSIRQSNTAVGSAMTLDLAWEVPDGSHAGDTFSLTLPNELTVLGGTDFALKDAGGDTVAKASIAGGVVTFTMTAYAGSHIGVHGSAFFSVALKNSIQPGPLDLVFTADSTVFRDHVDVGVLPTTDYSSTATKWAKLITPTSPGGDGMLWAITGPRVTGSAPITFTDTPGPGQAINCTAFTLWSGTANMSGSLVSPTFVPAYRWKQLECSETKAVVQFVPQSADVGKVFMLMGTSTITDPTRAEYTNSGSVAIGGGTIPVSTVVVGAGGEGTGTTAPPASGTTAPPASGTGTPGPGSSSTEPVSTATSTDTSTCAPVTVTATATVTQTATVIQTATVYGAAPVVTVPGPTVTVTVPATASATLPPVAPGTSLPNQASLPTSSASPSTGATPPPVTGATPPPVAGATSTSVAGGTTTSVAGGTTTSVAGGTTTSVAGATTTTSGAGFVAAPGGPGATVTGVNTGIAPAGGPDGWLLGLGTMLVAGSGAGLIALSRRRTHG